MNLSLLFGLTETLLAFAFIQQSIEHIFGVKREKTLYGIRMLLSIALLGGFATKWICLALLINAIFILRRFAGPYNGGSDRMSLLILFCLTLAHFVPVIQELAFAYLAFQVILSYFLPGVFKAINKDWWSGKALKELFVDSGFPVSENLRSWARHPRLLCFASWLVLIFELSFPVALLSQEMLLKYLSLAFVFHLANHYFFGFNRFIWIWFAAYPSLIWFQSRIFTSFY